jgi:segregation and condensation protein B
MTKLAAKIEAILYLKGQPLTLGQLCEYARGDREDVEEALIDLIDDYAHRDSALEVVETEGGYSLQLRETFQEVVQNLVPAELGVGALRTLAAIALKGPILQSELVDLRGSGAYQHVQELMELGLVRRRRSEGQSRSYRVQVTDKFHQYFQVEQLPPLDRRSAPVPDTNDSLTSSPG